MNAHPVEPPQEPKKPVREIIIDPYRFRLNASGTLLMWVVPGYTHYVASLN